MIIVLVIIAISILILVHELGHFLVAKKFGLLVEEFGIGFPPRLFSKKIGETLYSVNLLPFGGFVKIYGEDPAPKQSVGTGQVSSARAFYAQTAWKRALVISAGILMNFILGWLIMSAIFMIGVPQSLIVTGIALNSPAAIAGFQEGDQLTDFKKSDDFINFIDQNKGKEVSLNVVRSNEPLSVKVIPRIAPPAGEGALGVALAEAGLEKQSFFLSFWEGLKASVGIVVMIVISLGQLLFSFFTQGRVLEGFVGPIGIFGVANQAAGLGAVYLMQLIGLISLNLFILNILPFPALDGGRMFFILLEKIKGKPLSPNFERSANAIGFLVLLFLMIAVTVRDLIKLF